MASHLERCTLVQCRRVVTSRSTPGERYCIEVHFPTTRVKPVIAPDLREQKLAQGNIEDAPEPKPTKKAAKKKSDRK